MNYLGVILYKIPINITFSRFIVKETPKKKFTLYTSKYAVYMFDRMLLNYKSR